MYYTRLYLILFVLFMLVGCGNTSFTKQDTNNSTTKSNTSDTNSSEEDDNSSSSGDTSSSSQANGGGGGNNQQNNLTTNIFHDTIVSGLQYSYNDTNSTTNANGEFSYKDDASITFFIGNAVFGSSSSTLNKAIDFLKI